MAVRFFKCKLKQRKDEEKKTMQTPVNGSKDWIVWMGSILLTMQKLFCFIIVSFNCYYNGLVWNICSFIRIMCVFAIYSSLWCRLAGMCTGLSHFECVSFKCIQFVGIEMCHISNAFFFYFARCVRFIINKRARAHFVRLFDIQLPAGKLNICNNSPGNAYNAFWAKEKERRKKNQQKN